jgi:hypothetical protein
VSPVHGVLEVPSPQLPFSAITGSTNNLGTSSAHVTMGRDHMPAVSITSVTAVSISASSCRAFGCAAACFSSRHMAVSEGNHLWEGALASLP